MAPADPVEAVKLNAMVQAGAGSRLAAGIVPRLAAGGVDCTHDLWRASVLGN